MELFKYPLDKLLYFIAAILPGSVALLIFQMASPGSFAWFFRLGFLGYRTRFGLILLACFVVGYSATTILSRLLGAIGGAVGGFVGSRRYNRPTPSIAPWRDPRWRLLVRKQLRENAPGDTQIMSDMVFDLRSRMADNLPENDRQMTILGLQQEKLAAEMDDSRWEQWYDHYHQIILQPADKDFVWHVENGLNFNLQSASVYVLFSAILVPGIRHWWCILPASIWALLLVVEVYVHAKQYLDPWSTLSAQLIYLAKIDRGEKAPEI